MISINKKRQIEKDLYYQFADYMFTVCYRYVGNREIAEELLNNGFMKVFKHIHKFENRGENSLKYWIKKIMINECLMFLRRKNDFKQIQIETLNENLFQTNPIDSIDNEIMNIINKLPIGYRTVFNLFAIEGYSHAEISNQLGINESTSRSQLTMARKLLKKQIKDTGYETR
jgi:RNA polymerase sigma-70 factor (ECF subfamily)